MENATHTCYDRTRDIAIPIKEALLEWNIDVEATSFHGDLFDNVKTKPHTANYDHWQKLALSLRITFLVIAATVAFF